MSKNKFDKMAPAQFTHELFGTIRTLTDENGEIWFVARDVAIALGYKNTRDAISKHCKRVNSVAFRDGNRGNPFVTIIPESDFYRLTMRSKLPSAEQFEEWVCEEVLPAIRKHGAYVNKQMADPSWLREMADVIEQKNLEIAEKNKALAEARPKVICTENLTNDMQRFKPMLLAGMLKVSWGVFR